MFIETPVCIHARVFSRRRILIYCLLFSVTFALAAIRSVAQNPLLADQSQIGLNQGVPAALDPPLRTLDPSEYGIPL